MDEDDPELDCPFSCSLGPWENIFAGELDRCSSTREEVIDLIVHNGISHGPGRPQFFKTLGPQ